MKAVAIRDLGIEYKGKQAIRGLSVDILQGEFFVIIGPNGAGKTTLLKALSGMQGLKAGYIDIMGRPLNSYSRRRLSALIALVPQQVALDFCFTVADTVLMGRSPHIGLLGIERQQDFEIAHRAMEVTGVSHLASRRLDQLSGGEQQRVIIARAICQGPKIILLDEPTTALDPAHQINIMDLIERLRLEQDVTVIMVSHDLNLASMYGNRLLLMKDGSIVQIGTPDQVLTEDNLERAYGCRLLVDKNPIGPFPRVTLLPEKFCKFSTNKGT
ncbi:MAG: ATP-binding cassette domain-containing protein [Nitrospiraceae bacterium]|nr:ATP-binding cassette domain-containing protein [Nitrospiraceae bacterium]